MAETVHADAVFTVEPKVILDVVADLARYTEWAGDSVKTAEVVKEGPDGRPAEGRFVVGQAPMGDDYTVAYSWEGNSVHWTLVSSNMMKNLTGSYVLEPAAGGTKVTYSIAVEPKIKVPGMVVRKMGKQLVESGLTDLKKRCESLNG